jgi:hypothetical protein
VSGYYSHAEDVSKLEWRTALANPPPTLPTLSQEEVASVLCLPATSPGSADERLMNLGKDAGVFASIRDKSLYLADPLEDWSKIGIKHVWCDRSVASCLVCMKGFREDVKNAMDAGRTMREVQFVRLPKMNHFVSLFGYILLCLLQDFIIY